MTPPLYTLIAMKSIALHSSIMNPILTVGIPVVERPSSDNNASFCVSNPHAKPMRRLKLGPAKHAERDMSASPRLAQSVSD